jgi:LuxR family maltose regulon positive regulatory protein
VAPDVVPRPRLLDRLEQGRNLPLTLVSAPAGFGKSTLVSQWLEVQDEPSAWLSLDASDSDLLTFLNHLVAAIRTAFPESCTNIAALAHTAKPSAVSVLAKTLINDINIIDTPFALVLDDYHLIGADSDVHEVLEALLQHPPLILNLLILARRDPPLSLARVRANGQITDVRLLDLQLSAAESAIFLERAAGCKLSSQALADVYEKLEGWAAGLRLLALALHTSKNPDATVAGLKRGIPEIERYLLQEVLAQQTPELKQCLLKTSILNRFCASLSEAVCAPGSRPTESELSGSDFIHTASELLCVSLDDREDWFRYHHLFQALLLAELKRHFSPDEVATIHLRASEWFEAEGLIGEAINHAHAAEDVKRAAQIVERHWRSIMDDDKWYVLEEWLSRMPDSLVQLRPELLLASAWRHYYRLDVAAIPPILERVDDLMADGAQTHDLSGEVAFFRAFFSFLEGEGALSVKYVEHALNHIPVTNHMFRGEAECTFGLAGQMEGQLDRVARAIMGWLEDTSALHPMRETRLLVSLVIVYAIAGDTERAKQYTQRLRIVATSPDIQNPLAWSDYLEGLLNLQRGELDAAIRFLEKASARRYYQDVPEAAIDTLVALAFAYQARAQPEQAATTLQVLREFITHLGPSFLVFAESCAARLSLMQGRAKPALRWLEANAPPPTKVMLWWQDVPCVTRCRALLAKGSAESLREAAARLQEYADQNEAQHNSCQLIGILALQAIAYEKLGKVKETSIALERAITLARPGGIIFPFLELGSPMAELLQRRTKNSDDGAFGQEILSAFEDVRERRMLDPSVPSVTDHAAGTNLQLVEPLTNREIEVLELLSQRRRDKEIAKQLFISPETVKSHLRNIYGKLDAHNRREAVNRALEADILSSH